MLPESQSLAAVLLVPHQGDAVLLDRVWQPEERTTCASLRTMIDTPFTSAGAPWPDWLVIEIMAQVVAAGETLRDYAPGVRPRLGLLVGVRDFEFDGAGLDRRESLQVEVIESMREDSGMGVFDAVLRMDGEPVARATLSAYQPADVDGYLASLEP